MNDRCDSGTRSALNERVLHSERPAVSGVFALFARRASALQPRIGATSRTSERAREGERRKERRKERDGERYVEKNGEHPGREAVAVYADRRGRERERAPTFSRALIARGGVVWLKDHG